MGHQFNCDLNSTPICETMIAINDSQQEFWTKFIILTLVLLFSLYMYYKSKDIDPERSGYDMLRYVSQKYFVFIYILFSPLFYLYLRLDFEMFMMYLYALYGVVFAVSIGLVSLWGKNKIFSYFSKESRDNRQLKKKYGKEY